MGEGRRRYASAGLRSIFRRCHVKVGHGGPIHPSISGSEAPAALGRDRRNRRRACVSWWPTWPRRWSTPTARAWPPSRSAFPCGCSSSTAHVAGGAEDAPPTVFINPELVEISDEAQTGDEGCLSFPGIFVPVKRGMRAKSGRCDLDGNVFEAEGEALFARAMQHETDHLNGRLLIDQVGPVKREIIKRKLRKDAEAEREEAAERAANRGSSARLTGGLRCHVDDRSQPDRVRRPPWRDRGRAALDAQVRGRRRAGRRGGAARTQRSAGRHGRLQPGGRGDRRRSARASRTTCWSRWRAGWRPSADDVPQVRQCGSSCASSTRRPARATPPTRRSACSAGRNTAERLAALVGASPSSRPSPRWAGRR